MGIRRIKSVKNKHTIVNKMAEVSGAPPPINSGLGFESRDAIAEGMVDLLRPAVEEIDERVKTVR